LSRNGLLERSRYSVQQALHNDSWVQQIRGGLSMADIVGYLQVWHQIRNLRLSDTADKLIWKWTANGKFTVRSAYAALHFGSHPIPGCDWIWETWAPLRVKLFMWLALKGRQWTADRRRRHGLQANEHCFLCDQQEETIAQLVVSCSFAQQIWWNVATTLQPQMVAVTPASILDWWTTWRQHWTRSKRRGADSILLLVAWELWKERSVRCFRGANTQVPQFLATLKHEADLWVQAGARNLGCLLARVIQ
jgi:hypothetical protein